MKHTSPLKLALVPSLVAAAFLSGCASDRLQGQIDEEIVKAPSKLISEALPTVGIKGTAEDLNARAEASKSLKLVRKASHPWIGGSTVPVTKEDGLPALFNERYDLDLGPNKVSLSAVAAKLTKITGVPVRIRSDVYGIPTSGASASAAATNARTPTGQNQSAAPSTPSVIPTTAVSSSDAMSIDGLSIHWSARDGRLRDYLDHITNVLNLSWEYRDGSVVIMKMLTQTHAISNMIGEQNFATSIGSSATGSTGTSGSSGGGGGTTNSMQASSTYSERGRFDGFADVVNTVRSMVGTVPGTAVIPNPQTGSITVTASKEVQAQVRDYIEEQNKMLSRTVSVQIDIYSMTENEEDQQGVNLNAAFRAMSGDYGINFTSPASVLSTGVSSLTIRGLAGEGAGSQAILNALRSTGRSVVHKPIQMLTMNGKLKVQNSTDTQGYVQSTTPGNGSSSGSTGAPGINTSTLTVGDIFSVFPVIQPDNSVMLKYSFRMSNFLGFRTINSGVGAAQQTVESPRTSDIGDGADIRLVPGEAIMITGLSRNSVSTTGNRLTENSPQAAGGSTSNSIRRENLIVLLRATAL